VPAGESIGSELNEYFSSIQTVKKFVDYNVKDV